MNVASMIPVNYSLMILAMFVINGVICALCVCRLMKMRDILVRVKIQYIVGLVASAANGLAPLFFQQWPNGTAVFFSAWVCVTMLSDGYQWKHGAPKAALTVPAPLEGKHDQPRES